MKAFIPFVEFTIAEGLVVETNKILLPLRRVRKKFHIDFSASM